MCVKSSDKELKIPQKPQNDKCLFQDETKTKKTKSATTANVTISILFDFYFDSSTHLHNIASPLSQKNKNEKKNNCIILIANIM